MNEYKEIVSRQVRDYGRIEVKLKDQLDRRQMTRNRLRTLTGVKYDVIDRYYKHRLTRAHREKQLKMSCQALHNAPPNRT